RYFFRPSATPITRKLSLVMTTSSLQDYGSVIEEIFNLSGSSASPSQYEYCFWEAYVAFVEAVEFSKSDDAYDSGYAPLSSRVIEEGAKVLVSFLPETAVPEIVCLPGNGIGFQWNGAQGEIFTVSIFGN